MPAHRMCSTPGCGGPAVYGSLCWECCQERDVNTVDFGDGGGVPWEYDVPRHFLDQAVARVTRHDPAGTGHQEPQGPA